MNRASFSEGLVLAAMLGCGGVVTTSGSGADGGEGDRPTVPQPVPPSCTPDGPGRTDCGVPRENCCTSLEVQGGSFNRSYGEATPAYPATVSGFRLDKYDVTVGRFRRFVDAWQAGYRPSAGAGKHAHLNAGKGLANTTSPGTYETGWLSAYDGDVDLSAENLACGGVPKNATWTATPGESETHPINCVSWFEAYAFCIWDDGFLPSHAEWEFAAAGGSQQRQYPWGSAPPGTRNQFAIFGTGGGDTPEHCYYPDDRPCVGAVNIAPVGIAALGAGLWGRLDLAGNVWQWQLDEMTTYSEPCSDCANLARQPASRQAGGGSFLTDDVPLSPQDQTGDSLGSAGWRDIGFRCARGP
jgi:sulfatase modifying factor 1